MPRAKEFLDELKWHPEKSLSGVKITYRHRGAPNDEMMVLADDVLEFDKSFMIMPGVEGEEVYIPYHRILKIEQGGKVIWAKRK